MEPCANDSINVREYITDCLLVSVVVRSHVPKRKVNMHTNAHTRSSLYDVHIIVHTQTHMHAQDVSGFSLHSVWTLDRLTKAHEFMQVGGRAAVGQCTSTSESWCQQNFVREDFDTFESISAVLAPYALGPAQPHNYSYSVRICGSNYVEEIGQEGKHIWDLTVYFKYDTQTQTYSREKSKWFVWNSWKEHIEATADNVCQFVC